MTKGVDLAGYRLAVYQDPEDGSWVAEVPDLPGAVAAGMRPAEAVAGAEDAIRAWIEAAEADGRQVPAPTGTDHQYSGRFVVRLTRGLHRQLAVEAEREGVSLNTYCVAALSESLGVARGQRIALTASRATTRSAEVIYLNRRSAFTPLGGQPSASHPSAKTAKASDPFVLGKYVAQRG